MNDTFLSHGLAVLELAQWFLDRGKPVGLFGQGIGPAQDSQLRRRLAEVIPQCCVVGLREANTGPALLCDLGVSLSNVVVTGDDAIEIARVSPGDASFVGPLRIGINVRVASYSGLSEEHARRVVHAVSRCAAMMGTSTQPIPISWHDGDSDVNPLLAFLDIGGSAREEVSTPLLPVEIVRLVSRCCVVFTGSYHAAVFALSRGVPVVALSASEYYDSKFLGLSKQFQGMGLTIVRPDHADTVEKLLPVIQGLVHNAMSQADHLRELADRQIAASQTLYRRFINSIKE